MAHQHDDLEKVLAALNKATPPIGMEARIAQRLPEGPPTPSVSLAVTWWRGALTGAAAAALAIGVVLLAQHRLSAPQTAHQNPASPQIMPARNAPLTPVALQAGQPCSSPAITRIHKAAPVPLVTAAREESVQPSRPAPTPPLTAEERGLVRLAHIANPNELATLNPEIHARLVAQEEADFAKFFTPPPKPKPVEENE
jgi:hypothetical protein